MVLKDREIPLVLAHDGDEHPVGQLEVALVDAVGVRLRRDLRAARQAYLFANPVEHPSKIAGGSPAAGVFLLLGQKKVTKEKAAPANRRWRGAPALLGMDGAKAKLAELDARMREALAPYDGRADALRALGELAIHRMH